MCALVLQVWSRANIQANTLHFEWFGPPQASSRMADYSTLCITC